MNIEFIKWMCEKAEGFEYNVKDCLHRDTINYPMGDWDFIDNINQERFQLVLYPLLLIKAIDGVNSGDGYIIAISSSVIISDRDGNIIADFWRMADQDQAREAALKLVWENEK